MRIVLTILLPVCLFGGSSVAVDSLALSMENDPDYPSVVSMMNVNYQLLPGNVIDFSCDININEALTQGTKILVNVSPNFPYAALVDNMEFDLCSVGKKDMFLFRQLMNASNIPNTCPIQPGLYSIRNFQMDLSRYPMSLRGFDVTSSYQVYNGDRILARLIGKCTLQ